MMNITNLTNTIKAIMNRGTMYGIKMNDLDETLDAHILDLLVEFCVQHEEFHVYNLKPVIEDSGFGKWGAYYPMRKTVVINKMITESISKRLSSGIEVSETIATRHLKQMISTMLHEHRHAWQYHTNQYFIHLEQVSSSEDYDAYYNHPIEVDARWAAEVFEEEAIEYIVKELESVYY